jgi:hypothetical protein
MYNREGLREQELRFSLLWLPFLQRTGSEILLCPVEVEAARAPRERGILLPDL